jgi:hypothetical protein
VTVRSDVLVAHTSTTGAVGLVAATVPAGQLWIVKDISIYNADTAVNSDARVLNSRAAVTSFGVWSVAVPFSTAVFISGRFIVFEAGDNVLVRSSAAVSMRWLMCGARLIV